jgi:very-short-patch-repair endonuclease
VSRVSSAHRRARSKPERFDPARAEEQLAATLTMLGEPFSLFEQQFPYVPGRRFAADFAYPAVRLLIEIQGGLVPFTREDGEVRAGAHGSVSGVLRDLERTNLAALNGWRMLRFPPDAMRESRIADTIDTIEKALRWSE